MTVVEREGYPGFLTRSPAGIESEPGPCEQNGDWLGRRTSCPVMPKAVQPSVPVPGLPVGTDQVLQTEVTGRVARGPCRSRLHRCGLHAHQHPSPTAPSSGKRQRGGIDGRRRGRQCHAFDRFALLVDDAPLLRHGRGTVFHALHDRPRKRPCLLGNHVHRHGLAGVDSKVLHAIRPPARRARPALSPAAAASSRRLRRAFPCPRWDWFRPGCAVVRAPDRGASRRLRYRRSPSAKGRRPIR